jgi:hypothetical protein
MASDDRSEMEANRLAGLAKRHETREARAIERAILNAEWKAQDDDTVDGWCVTDAVAVGTPGTGNVPIAHFCHATAARHIAAIHNVWLAHNRYLPIPADVEATVRTQVAEEIAAALETVDGVEWALAGHHAGLDAARIAREIGSRDPQ